jgi:tetrathionate reductase subunit A
VARYKSILPAVEWRQASYALARGGVFSVRYGDVFDGEKHKYGIGRVALYNETLATTRNSISGEYFAATLKYTPPLTPTGRDIEAIDRDYPFSPVTHKMSLHAQSRTVLSSVTMEVVPTNHVHMLDSDARRLGFQDLDPVRLISRSNPTGITGSIKLTRLLRPGTVGVSFHYGHTQFGASSLAVQDAASVFLGGSSVADGSGLKANPGMGTGTNFNAVARLDEDFGNTPLVDVCGGIPDFSSTRVKIVRA